MDVQEVDMHSELIVGEHIESTHPEVEMDTDTATVKRMMETAEGQMEEAQEEMIVMQGEMAETEEKIEDELVKQAEQAEQGRRGKLIEQASAAAIEAQTATSSKEKDLPQKAFPFVSCSCDYEDELSSCICRFSRWDRTLVRLWEILIFALEFFSLYENFDVNYGSIMHDIFHIISMPWLGNNSKQAKISVCHVFLPLKIGTSVFPNQKLKFSASWSNLEAHFGRRQSRFCWAQPQSSCSQQGQQRRKGREHSHFL